MTGRASNPRNDLIQQLRAGKVMIITGAGVTLTAAQTGTAKTWEGLLRSLMNHSPTRPPATQQDDWERDLKSNQLDRKLFAVNQIKKFLDPDGSYGEFTNWLNNEFGHMRASPDGEVFLRDLVRLTSGGAALCTLNYDGLLVNASGWPPITWLDHEQFSQIRQLNNQAIFHLHGYYRNPASVVISLDDYGRIVRDDSAQALLRAIQATETLFYIGCGDTLSDPNFAQFIEWAKQQTSSFSTRHYILLSQEDAEKRAIEFGGHNRTYIINYDELYVAPGTATKDVPKYVNFPRFIKALADEAFPPAAPVARPDEPPPHERVVSGVDSDRDWVIDRLLNGGAKRHVVLFGPGGIGKTNLATAVMTDPQVEGQFVGGCFFVDCRARAMADDVALGILEHLGGQDTSQSPVKSALAALKARSEPLLLVLDNLETPFGKDAARDSLTNFMFNLSRIAQVTLLGTLREQVFPGQFWSDHAVKKVEPATASEIFKLYAGSKFEVFKSHPAFQSVLNDLDGIPLAIRLVASFSRIHNTFQPTVDAWNSHRHDALNTDGILTASVQVTLDHLKGNDSALALAFALAQLPAGLTRVTAEQLVGVQATRDVLTISLADETPDDQRLSLLAPVREILAGEAYQKPSWWPGPQAERIWAATRDYYVNLAVSGDQIGRDGGAERAAHFDVEHPNISAVLLNALKTSPGTLLNEAFIGLSRYLSFRGLANPKLFHKAVDVARQNRSPETEALIHLLNGDIVLRRSDHDAARQQYEKALPLYQQIGDILGQANCISRLGDIVLRRSDHDAARQQYEKALPLYQQIGAILGQANCIRSLGRLELLKGNVQAARTQFEDALTMYTQIPEPYSMGVSHVMLGLVSEAEERRQHAQKAIELFTRIDLPHMVEWVKQVL